MNEIHQYIQAVKNIFKSLDFAGQENVLYLMEQTLFELNNEWESNDCSNSATRSVLIENGEQIIMEKYQSEREVFWDQNWELDKPIEKHNEIINDGASSSIQSINIIECSQCGNIYDTIDELQKHAVEMGHICQRIYEVSSRNEAEGSVVFNGKDISIRCFTCSQHFANRKGLYRHGLKTGHQTREKRAPRTSGGPIRCYFCKFSTTTLYYLMRHQKRLHNVHLIPGTMK